MRRVAGVTFALAMTFAWPAPAHAAGCNPICAVGGLVSGSNLYLPLEGSFAFDLSFQGASAGAGAVRQVSSYAVMKGTVQRVSGRTSTGLATMFVYDDSLEAAVPMRLSATGVTPGAGSASSAVFEPLSVVALGGGHGTTITLHDTDLTGFVHVARALPDEGVVARSDLVAPELFVQGAPFLLQGRVETATGVGLPGVPVDIVIDDEAVATVTTNSNGDWVTEMSFDDLDAHRVRGVVLGDTPVGFESPTRWIEPGYPVTVDVVGSGTVAGGPISCPGICEAVLPLNSFLPLFAEPATFHAFDGWGGDCEDIDPSCTLVVAEPLSITATFSLSNADIVESEPNGTPATANALPVPALAAGALTQGDVDLYGIEVSAHTSLLVETFDRWLTCDGIDPIVAVLDTDGTLIGTDDDSGPNFCSKLTVELLPGSYLVRVTPYGSTSAEEYRLKLTPILMYEPNETLAAATSMDGFPGSVTTSIAPVGDIDHFSFSIMYPESVTIATDAAGGASCSQIDTVITLFADDGTQLATNDDVSYPGNLCSRIEQSLPAGTYVVRVVEYGSNEVIPAYELRTSGHY